MNRLSLAAMEIASGVRANRAISKAVCLRQRNRARVCASWPP